MKKIILMLLGWAFSIQCIASGFVNLPRQVTLTLGDAYYHFNGSRGLENTSLPNVALAYNFTDQWAVEGEVGIINVNQRASNTQRVHGVLYLLDGVYRFHPYNLFQPYALAGIGVLGLKPLTNGTEHQGNVNAGVGTQFFIDKRIALRAEFRDVYTLSGGKNDWLVGFGVSFLI